jgi:hypothetical protein
VLSEYEFKNKKKVKNESHDKNDMQAWIAEVLMKGLCWVLKWNEEKVLLYELRNNFILYDGIMWMK